MQVLSGHWEFAQDLVEPVAWVDARRFDTLWMHGDDFVGPDGKGSNQPGKYQRVGAHILEHARLFYPHVCLINGVPSFTDGRHRTAWLRDHGAEAIPMTCSEEDRTQLRRLCPTPIEKSFFFTPWGGAFSFPSGAFAEMRTCNCNYGTYG